MLLTIQQYSRLIQQSQQAVYQRISRGSLDIIEQDNIKYIEIKDSLIQEIFNVNTSDVKEEPIKQQSDCKEIKRLYKQSLKQTQQQLKQQKKDSSKQYRQLEKVLNMVLQIQQIKTNDTPVIEAKIVKSKKKKHRKKKKNKKK